MAVNTSSGTARTPGPRNYLILLACLLAVLAALFHRSLLPGQVIFNNDAPLGTYMMAALQPPGSFTGIWTDLNWLGLEWPASASLSMGFFWLVGAVGFSKFWVPASLLILGLSAGFFFKSLRLSPPAYVLGGLAASLQSFSFSGACWGQTSGPVALGAMFLALGLLQNNSGWRGWIKVVLAGLLVGCGVIEGFDKAALFSLVVAAYVLYQAWATRQKTAIKWLFWGGLQLSLVAGFAALMAIQAVSGLISTQIHGVAGAQQDERSKQERWDWATQWSLPKSEALGFLVPGLFGYRMDTPDGGNYWGKEGRDPAWDRYFASGKQGPPPQGFLRFVGGGNYVGPLLTAVALWGLLQSFRKKSSPFTITEKKLIWFWAVLGGVGLLLAFGRFAPFYRLFYALPYASTIRNPDKFSMYFGWAVLVLFTYGVHGLSQRIQWNPVPSTVRGLKPQWRSGWATAPAFDKRWVYGSVAFWFASLLGWMVYDSQGINLQHYLQEVGFDSSTAAAIARFSVRQVGWYLLSLTLALGSMALVLSGYFAGSRARFGAVLLGAVLVLDLGHANLPWIKYWDYPQKYASNPVLDHLRENAWEQRVALLPQWIPSAFQLSEQARGMAQSLDQLYRIEWAQHHFLYYNIQSLDVIQMPRPPVDYVAFENALQVRSGDTLHLLTRKWELTNTRYVFAMTGLVDLLNQQFDPGRQRFRVVEQFNIVPKPGIDQVTKLDELTARPATNGVFAVIEFTGALPRAKLYSQWQVSTNDEATLQQLASPAFDAAQTLLVADSRVAAPPVATNQTLGTVEFKSYAPKHILLQTQADTAGVLLLNDRFADGWQVRVDGKPDTLLRCNYLMRGVHLGPGAHTVEFVFQRPTTTLKVCLAAFGLTLLLLGVLILTRRNEAASAE